jgi:hypothetical protein
MIKSKLRNYYLFFTGFLCGFIWIFPVFNEPQLNISPSFIERLFRTIYLLILLPLCFLKLLKNIKSQKVIFYYLIAFLPSILISSVFSLSFSFLISTSIPVLFSIIGVLILTSLNYSEFNKWIMGVSFISIIFLLIGMLKFGFTPSDFFGRPRVHFGFTHPVQTASVILASFFPFTILPNHLPKKVKTVLIFLLLTLLFLAQSINILLTVLIFYLFTILINIKINKYIIFSLGFFIFILPYTIFIANYLSTNLFEIFNLFTSGRLMHFTETIMNELKNDNILNLLFGPMYEIRMNNYNSDLSKGFSFIDSVYFSFLFNFGIFGFLCLIFFAYYIFLNSFNKNKISFALLTGLLFFYSADSQGFTPNNLIIFSILSFIIKSNFSKLRYEY